MYMINNKSTVDMIHLDFSNAFNQEDLRDLDITGRQKLWFFYFLNNRHHYVSALDFNFERAVEGSILTAGKRLSLKI